MENNLFYSNSINFNKQLMLLIATLMAIFFGWLISGPQIKFVGVLILAPFLIGFFMLVFLQPRIGFLVFIVYSFFMPTLVKHTDGGQFGLGVDALLLLTWLGVIFNRSSKYRFRHLNTDLVGLAIVWLVVNILQMLNPELPAAIGWLQEMRSATLYWVLLIPLTILVFNKKSDVQLFLDIIIFISLLGALYGIMQLNFGVDAAENRWLEAGGKQTHMIFGKLRIFSFYTEAAQFGASQAQVAIICFILALGPHTKLRKFLYVIVGLFLFYGMTISGTRSALAGIVGGGFIFLVLCRQIKVILLGVVVGLSFLCFLKFSTIGNSNDNIRRLRSGVDANDASFQVRLQNQRILKEALKNKPFGTGVGTSGEWGKIYNQHISTAQIPPDSLVVKVWVMYGVIGLILWLSIMFYILGKSAGIIWNTRDPVLRNQLSALCAGFGGVLIVSYGNEIMNTLPSSTIVYVSWALIWMSTRWDTPIQKIA